MLLTACETASQPEGAAQRQSRRILVAEDNPLNQMVIQAVLEQLGHASDIVADGQAAVDQIRSTAYDLILMDMMMPRMDGIAAIRAIRALTGQPAQVPIIMMSANAMPQDRARSSAAGCDGFVPKPIDVDLLEAEIERVTASRRGEPHARSGMDPAPGRADPAPARVEQPPARSGALSQPWRPSL